MVDQQTSGDAKICPACAETIKRDASVCRYCGQEFAVSRIGYCEQCHRQVEVDTAHACPTCGSAVIDVVVTSEAVAAAPAPAPEVTTAAPPQQPPEAPSAPAGASAVPSDRRSGRAIVGRILLGLLIVAAIVGGVIFVMGQIQGEARSPRELSDQFIRADITCTKLQVIYDDKEQKALGCVSTDSHIITVTTFGDRPSRADWLDSVCQAKSSRSLRAGATVTGDDYFIEIVQGPYPKDLFTVSTPKAVAKQLAGVLGGTAGTFDCDARPGS